MFAVFLWILSLAAAAIMFFTKRNILSIIIYGVFGSFTAGAFFFMGAPDVSFASFSLGAAFTTFVFLISLRQTGKIFVYYEKTDYLLNEDEEGKQWGFEYEILSMFARKEKMVIEFVSADENFLLSTESKIDILAGGIFHEKFPPGWEKDFFELPIIPTRLFLGKNGEILDFARLKKKAIHEAESNENWLPAGVSSYIFLVSRNSEDLYEKLYIFIKKLKEDGSIEEIVRKTLG